MGPDRVGHLVDPLRLRRRLAGFLAVALLVGGCASQPSTVEAGSETTTPTGGSGRGWQAVAPAPLSARADATVVAAGGEVLVFGGERYACPANASCFEPEDPPFRDAAAYDPEADHWRELRSLPVAIRVDEAVAAAGDVYALGRPHSPPDVDPSERPSRVLLRYSLEEDTWTEVTVPENVDRSTQLVDAGGRLVAVPRTDERGPRRPLQVLDADAGTWADLPADPRSPAFDRSAVWVAPFLYVFDRELVDRPGSERPDLVRAARYSFETGTWERLPDSEALAAPWFVEGPLVIGPSRGGADGGESNGWGRRYPYGTVFDTSTSTWRELPPPVLSGDESFDLGDAAIVGSRTALVRASGGTALDAVDMRWIEVPALPGHRDRDARTEAPVDGGTFVFGGVRRPDGGGPEYLADAWLWRPDPAGPASTVTSAPPSVDPTATTAPTRPTPSTTMTTIPATPPRGPDPTLRDVTYGCGPTDAAVVRAVVEAPGEQGTVSGLEVRVEVDGEVVGRSAPSTLDAVSIEIEVEVSLTQAQWDLGTADVLLTEAGSGRVLSRAPVALRLPFGGGCG